MTPIQIGSLVRGRFFGLREGARKQERWLRSGFTQVPNNLMRDTAVSPTARLLYILLLSRDFGDAKPFPGQTTLAQELGVKSKRSVYQYIKELEKADWLTRKRRGYSKTHAYNLKRLPPLPSF